MQIIFSNNAFHFYYVTVKPVIHRGIYFEVEELYLLEITLYNPLKLNRRFGGICRLHLHVEEYAKLRQYETDIMFCSSKRRLNFAGLHGDIFQKIELFVTTAVRNSLRTYFQAVSPILYLNALLHLYKYTFHAQCI
jgi:hypothetical protein